MDGKITERLIKLRKEHNLSQEQLADELGVSRQAVSKWERGEASPDTDNLIALARLYGTSLDGLIFDAHAEPEAKEEEKCELTERETAAEINEEKEEAERSHMDTAEGVVAGVIVFLSCIVFFLLGGVWGLWHPGWIVFLAVPVLPTAVSAIKKRDHKIFCYPVLVTAVYLLLGCQWGLWHPWWVIFLTVPIYYIICDFFKKS